jgi:hypothetical protein
LISVDFPAPFSPMSACTSPGWSRSETPSRARTLPKVMEMSRISTTGRGASDEAFGPFAG